MHSVIVGCGRVGAELARELESKGSTVSIIDRVEASFAERLHPGFHGKKILGIGFDRDVLEEAGVKDADIFVSVTRGDNTNIVSSRIAKEYYNVKNVAALIYDPRRAQIYERLGISTVAMVSWATDQVLARVLPASESVEWTVGSGEVVVVGVQAPEHLVGNKVASLQEPERVRVAAVTRFGQTIIPTDETLIQEGDFIHLAVLRSALTDLEDRMVEPAAEE
jgi:trk system potassium uptake protein TrkA